MSLKAPSNFCRVIKKQRLKTVWTKTQKVICCCKPSSGRNDDYINCVKRQRLVTTPPYRATLAGCSWASRVQTRRHGVQLPARSSASVVSTSWNCANQSQVSHHGNIFDPPPNSSWSSAAQLLSYGRRAFCVAGLSVWNSLPDSLRNPIIGGNSFRQSLKTFLFATYWCNSAH